MTETINPMITIFNGRMRKLGGEKPQIYAQINVHFREYLHVLKGAPLAVFLAISLHTNQHGWAWPGRSLLAKETGYNITTVSHAISRLCKTKINGQRLLLRYQPQASNNGSFDSNQYLIFPSTNEVAQFEGSQMGLPCIENLHTQAPCIGLASTVEPSTGNPYTKINHLKEEPNDDDDDKSDSKHPTRESAILTHIKDKYDHPAQSATLDSITLLYESEIDGVTPGVTQKLIELLEQHPLQRQWEEAFTSIVMSNVRRLDYLTTCLQNAGKPKMVKPK